MSDREKKGMPVVYVAGPYRSETEYGVHINIFTAETAAVKIWGMGAVALCPHKNSAYFGGAVDDEVFLEGDCELLKRCDAMFALEDAEESEGAMLEIALAKKLGIPIFRHLVRLQSWIQDTNEQKTQETKETTHDRCPSGAIPPQEN